MKKNVLIILVVLAVLLIGVGVTALVMQNKPVVSNVNPTATSTLAPTVVPQVTNSIVFSFADPGQLVQNQKSEVKIMIKNVSSFSVKISGLSIELNPANNVTIELSSSYSPYDGWVWAPVTTNGLAIVGATSNRFSLAAGESKQVAVVNVTPQVDFNLDLNLSRCNVIGLSGISIINRSTQNSFLINTRGQ